MDDATKALITGYVDTLENIEKMLIILVEKQAEISKETRQFNDLVKHRLEYLEHDVITVFKEIDRLERSGLHGQKS